MKVDYKDLGIRIKKKREEMRMSQAELASLADLSTKHISNVENARSRVGLEKLVAIANVLNCSVDELLCGSLKAGCRSIYSDEVAEIIEDFSDAEMSVLPVFLRNLDDMYSMLKRTLDENRNE